MDRKESRISWFAVVMTALVVLAASNKCAHGRDFKLLELRETSLNYKYFVHPGRDPLFINEHHKEELNLHLNLDVFKYLFINNMVHSKTSPSQYRVVGLNSKIGVHVTKHVDIQYEHFSKHLLDKKHEYMNKFPVEDSIGINLIFYTNDLPKNSIF